MPKQLPGLLVALLVGALAGAGGMYWSVASDFEMMTGLMYVRMAGDARRDVSVLEEIRNHQEAGAITRLESSLLGELVSLSDYEKIVVEERRDPLVYESIATGTQYARSHPEMNGSSFLAAHPFPGR